MNKILFFFAGWLFINLVYAQDLSGMRKCAAEHDDTQRLACFDREAALLLNSKSTPAAKSETKTSKKAAEEKFGYQGTLARPELDRQAATENAVDKITGTIVELKPRPRGELVMTLDNGQVWAEKTATPASSQIKSGAQVTISRGMLGAFYLSDGKGHSTQVTRIK